ncbi:MAG TPA: PP2C family protein-serine/threonine phosphatase [Bryobacteraceae bacterium]|nr:PP2C family protein-serine/threonine phosphatase [Bryobacteraceae bacterium]
MTGVKSFWQRITDGIELEQLFIQFRAEARASYDLYSKEIDWKAAKGESHVRRSFRIAKAVFWAMMMKLSPGRRLLLLVSLVLLMFPHMEFNFGNGQQFKIDGFTFFGGVGLLILLSLELADRVMLKRDLEIAKEIQSWLMPASAPKVPGIDIAFTTRPANTVAGDYYDAFFRPGEPRRLLVAVADVAGKSVPAALLMATLQASLRTLAEGSGSLLEVAGMLNRYVCAQNPEGRRFTTGFLMEIDPATREFVYINAGHNWPVLRRASGAVERLETGGLPFGIMTAAPYETGAGRLEAGDILIIFTDGLVEAENERQDEYGEERMLGLIAGMKDGTAADALSRLTTSVNTFVGATRQHDDITCLILRVS